MIQSKKDLKYYIKQDALKSQRKSTRRKVVGDEIWKFQVCLRKLEYSINCKKITRFFYKWKRHRLSLKLGIEISPNCFQEGLWIKHSGGIVINSNARIGKNCTIHHNITIGNDGIIDKSAVIGDNCFIGVGSIIIGDIKLGDNTIVGAGACVTNSFSGNCTLIGIPAKIRNK